MLARARRTIKRLETFKQNQLKRTYTSRKLTVSLAQRVNRQSLMQRLDLIRIRLLKLQLDELHKIKAILLKKIEEQEEQRREIHRQRELGTFSEMDHLKDIIEEQKQKIAEQGLQLCEEHQKIFEQEQKLQEQQIEMAKQQEQVEDLMNKRAATQTDSPRVRAADSTFVLDDLLEDLPPSLYTTPEDHEANGKDSRCSTIAEEDDLVPRDTPPRTYPRQSIGQWSVERAKNNLSVRSLISSLEDKTGARSFARNRLRK